MGWAPDVSSINVEPAELAEASRLKGQLLERLFGIAAFAAGGVDRLEADSIPLDSSIVGVGYGVRENGTAEGPALRVYVRAKRRRSDLTVGELVPDEVDGVPTDVIPVGDPTAYQGPVPCGVSVGHVSGRPGTLGCLVTQGNRQFILSNNHVLANTNAAQPGDRIVHPATTDSPRPTAIARLSAYHPLDWARGNVIDAAIAELLEAGVVHPAIVGIGRVGQPPATAVRYQSVRKTGRTTGTTTGVVEDLSASIRIRYGNRVAVFANQIAVRGVAGPFSQPGDSGSLVVDAASQRAVALLFGGGGSYAFCNPIGLVLSRFGVSIV